MIHYTNIIVCLFIFVVKILYACIAKIKIQMYTDIKFVYIYLLLFILNQLRSVDY